MKTCPGSEGLRGGQVKLQGGVILEEITKIYMELSRQRGERAFLSEQSQEQGQSVEQQYALSAAVGEIAWSRGLSSDDA